MSPLPPHARFPPCGKEPPWSEMPTSGDFLNISSRVLSEGAPPEVPSTEPPQGERERERPFIPRAPFLQYYGPSGPIGPDGLFVSQRTGSHSAGIHVPFTNCFVCRWFCVVHDPKPPLHSFGKFQDTERFLIHCERHFSSRLPPNGGTWQYKKKTWRDSLPIDTYVPFCRVRIGCCAVEFGNPGATYE